MEDTRFARVQKGRRLFNSQTAAVDVYRTGPLALILFLYKSSANLK